MSSDSKPLSDDLMHVAAASPCRLGTTVLIVSNRFTTSHELGDLPYGVERFVDTADVLQRLHYPPTPTIVLLDLGTATADRLGILEQVRKRGSKVIIVAPSGDAWITAEALRMGAHQVLAEPIVPGELARALQLMIGDPIRDANHLLTPCVDQLSEDMSFVAASPSMLQIRAQAELLANINVPVLIVGESGTGKEVIAKLIHKLSPRAQRKFLKVNCAALPSELLESELFGYDSGAFTGATKGKLGKFELCDKGTILLDEIGEMPANLQAKLLHVAQDKEFFRLGGDATISVDVRMLAATNIDIQQAIAEKKFRGDLYYRLAAFTIYLPPLRERREEIPILLEHFMSRMARRYLRDPLPLSPVLEQACINYAWPGNLRELENFVKRYLVLRDDRLALKELHQAGLNHYNGNGYNESGNGRNGSAPAAYGTGGAAETGGNNGSEAPESLTALLRNMKQETEAQAISRALEKTHWNRKHAARLLRISYRGLLYKIRQHNLVPPPKSIS